MHAEESLRVLAMRSKHIDVNYRCARERVARRDAEFKYIRTDEMPAGRYVHQSRAEQQADILLQGHWSGALEKYRQVRVGVLEN